MIRMSARSLPPIVLSACLATGCAVQSREEVLDPMVGQDVDVAIEAFGQPEETKSLEDGKNLYIWRRVYDYDVGRQSMDWPDRRHDDWFFDRGPEIVDVRVCSTSLVVGFDFVSESWDYGCETVLVERDRWESRPVMPRRLEPRRDSVKPAN